MRPFEIDEAERKAIPASGAMLHQPPAGSPAGHGEPATIPCPWGCREQIDAAVYCCLTKHKDACPEFQRLLGPEAEGQGREPDGEGPKRESEEPSPPTWEEEREEEWQPSWMTKEP